MADTSERIIILTAIALVIVIGLSTQISKIELRPPELPNKITIGVISPTNEDNQKYEFFVNVAEQDINNHTFESGIETSFEFKLFSGERTATKLLEIVQLLHENGVDLIVGGGWSSQLCAMESYVNVNGVVVISQSSTSSVSHLMQTDNIFRLSPNDFKLGDDMANIINLYGVNAVVVLAREDIWGIKSYPQPQIPTRLPLPLHSPAIHRSSTDTLSPYTSTFLKANARPLMRPG